MACSRCKHSTNDITFNFKLDKERVRVEAVVCPNCGFISGNEKQYLDAIRKHMKWMKSEARKNSLK